MQANNLKIVSDNPPVSFPGPRTLPPPEANSLLFTSGREFEALLGVSTEIPLPSLEEILGSFEGFSKASQDNVMPNPTHEEIHALIGKSNAETDTKIVRMEGKLDLVISKLDGVREDNRSTRANQWVIGLGLAVLIVAIAALFPVFFGIGAQLRDLVHAEFQSQLPVPVLKPNTQK